MVVALAFAGGFGPGGSAYLPVGASMPGSENIGVLAALLLAIYPLQVWYASEARMYILAQALGLVAVILGWGLIRHSRNRGGAGPGKSDWR